MTNGLSISLTPHPTQYRSFDQGYNDGLIGSLIRAFDWYQNYRPWMTLNSRYALYCKKMSFGAYCTNLNEDRPILCLESSSVTPVSGNKGVGLSLGVSNNGAWGCRRRQFLAI